MAVYLIETPSGDRLIEARTQASAINHVMKSEITATTLNTTALVQKIKAGMEIESITDEDEVDENQTDLEEVIAEDVAEEEQAQAQAA